MKKLITYPQFFICCILLVIAISSCKKLYEVDQKLEPAESKLYGDLYEFRSAMMGLYGLQQKLVEQLLVLGELRGDLLQVTPNADADMIEVYNFNISKNNKYASPTNFFRLISATNRFIKIVSEKYPEVLDKNAPIGMYDWFYGEAMCMRAWAYFNAVRIYGKVPYIHESLSSVEEIEQYLNTPGDYVDSVYIVFKKDGYYNDTIVKDTTLVKQYFDIPMVINTFTRQLETKIKLQGGTYGVGYNYSMYNNDESWEVTTWHPYSMFALLGHMYLTLGNYVKANLYFERILKNNSSNDRYELDRSFSYDSWRNIFTGIDNREHIFTIWFNKDFYQQNQIQDFFVNKYMLKPTRLAIEKWERCRIGSRLNNVTNPTRPDLHKMSDLGFPGGDYYRGFGVSYTYKRTGGGVLSQNEYFGMRILTSQLDFRSANSIMDGTDTVVSKYTINMDGIYAKDSAKIIYNDKYEKDANYIIYRAAGIHLYVAEIYTYWMKIQDNGILSTDQGKVKGIINDGSYYGGTVGRTQLGVRGRVYLGGNGVNPLTPPGFLPGTNWDGINTNNILYYFNPYTNEITGYKDISADAQAKLDHLEAQVLNERALELAYEGERFYDLIRYAKRRNEPAFLAKIVSEKFPSAQRQAIYNHLLNERNWYINYFD